MHITKLDIKNFRGIKKLEIEDLKTVNIFLGKNNVGKTSILEAIFLSMAQTIPQFTITIDNLRNLGHNKADDFKYIFYHLDYDNTIEISSKYHYDHIEKILVITPNEKNNIPINGLKGIKELGSSVNNIEKNLVTGLNLRYEFKKKNSTRDIQNAKIEFDISNGVFNQTPAKRQDNLNGTYLKENSLFNNLNFQLNKIIENKQEGIIINYLKIIDENIQGLALGSDNIVLVDSGFEKRYPINLLGDGAIKMLAILLAIYNSTNGIVLVDEFSNGLHYTAIKGLWKAIFKASKENNVQIFLTSHDYEALKYLISVLEEDDFKEYQHEIASYTIRKLPNDELKSYLYDFDKLELAIKENNELR